MKIYEKIVRKLKNINGEITDIIKKDILKKIDHDLEILKTKNITFGVEPLTTKNLTDFYQNIYVPIIGSKENAKVNNLLEIMDENEIINSNRFFIFIRNGDILLGGGICNHIENTLRFSYKCNTKEDIKLKAGFGTLIDYLFFSFGIEKSVKHFTYGSDRNGYGALGAAHGLCVHKLLLGFKAYAPKTPTFIHINEKDIHIPTIIFDEANEEGILQKVYLLHRENNNNNYIDILTKKGFIISYI